MIVYLAAFIALAFYLLAMPVKIGVLLRTDGEEKLRLGVSLFGRRVMFGGRLTWGADGLSARIGRAGGGRQREIALRGKVEQLWGGAAALGVIAKILASSVRVERVAVDICVATGEAMRTAILYGAAAEAIRALRVAKPQWRVQGRVRADFSSSRGRASAMGILSFRLGHIIGAVLCAAWEYQFRRTRTWINTRLNRS